jgi:hypothetical protein
LDKTTGKGFGNSEWFVGSSDVLVSFWFLDFGDPPFSDTPILVKRPITHPDYSGVPL